jgi:hypothetical protein
VQRELPNGSLIREQDHFSLMEGSNGLTLGRGTDRTALHLNGAFARAETVQTLVSDARRLFESNGDGQNSQVYPALARVPRDGIAWLSYAWQPAGRTA